MSEKRCPVTHYCNFCGEGLEQKVPLPSALSYEVQHNFKPKPDRDGRWVTLKVAIGMGISGPESMDMCRTCQKQITEEAVKKLLLLKGTQEYIDKAIAALDEKLTIRVRDMIQTDRDTIRREFIDRLPEPRPRKKGGR